MISRLCSLALLLVLGGCGLKGPLYLPDDRGQEVSPQSNGEQNKSRTRTAPGQAQPPTVPTDTTPSPTPPGH